MRCARRSCARTAVRSCATAARGVGVAVRTRRGPAGGSATAAAVVVVCLALAGAGAAPVAAAPGGVTGPGVPGDLLGRDGSDLPDRADLDLPEVVGDGTATGGPTTDGATAPEQVLVRFADGASASARSGALRAVGTTAGEHVGRTGFVAVDVGERPAAEVAAELAAVPGVADVQVDHVRTAAAWTDDEYVDEVWPYLDLVGLPSAWEQGTGEGVVVAVLDTSVRTSHEELRARLVPGRDVLDDDADPSGRGDHGTLVAGIALAEGDNGRGSVGAAPGALLMPVRVLDDDGRGTDSAVAAGITWAVDHGADVLNLSLAGPEPSPVLASALRYAVGAGAVVVAAAGNTGTSEPQYPAAYAADVPGVLAVATVDDLGDVPDDGSSWGDGVDLVAPGVDVIGPGGSGDASYVLGTGSSAAAPFVAGVAATVVAQHPTWTPAQVENRLLTTARDAGPRGRDPWYGSGVLDAAAAVGRSAGLPLDRRPEPAALGDLPADAAEVRLGEPFDVDLDAVGDRDWFRVEVEALTDYEITHPSGWEGFPREIDVLDASGRQVPREGLHTYRPQVGGTMYVRVQAPSGVVRVRGRHQLRVERSTVQRPADRLRFGDAEVVGRAPRVWAPDTESVVVDVTGDGVEDVVGTDAVRPPSGGIFGHVQLYPGTAAGGWEAGPALDRRYELGSTVRVADVEGDALPEVVVCEPGAVHVLGARDATWSERRDVVTGAGGACSVGDVDGDGDGDLLLQDAVGTVVARHDPDGRFAPSSVPGVPRVALVVADVDGSGLPDLVGPGGSTWVQQELGAYVPGPAVAGLAGTARVRVVDVDGDGRPDLLGTVADGSHRLVRPVAAGGFGAAVEVPSLGRFPRALDVDGDGLRDLVATGSGSSASVILSRQAPDGTFGAVQAVGADSRSPAWVTVRQAAGDDRADLVTGGSLEGVVAYPRLDTELPPGPAAWVWSIDPSPHTAGVAVRPTVVVGSRRTLAPDAATATTVRLLDAAGRDVPARRTTSVADGRVTLQPSVDLVIGGHYEVVVDGLVDAGGDTQAGAERTWFTVGAAGERFTPLVEPLRLVDTRHRGVPVHPADPLDLRVAAELVPDATAVVLNVTAVTPSGSGHVSVVPGTSRPGVGAVSSINVVAGVTQPNAVTVRLGDDRDLRLTVADMSAHLVVDIAGYYAPGGATGFVATSPARVLDTRRSLGAPDGRLAAGTWVDLRVAGTGAVPPDAAAVVLNVTGVGARASTHVSVYPTPPGYESDVPPTVSNLNLLPGRDQPNLVTVRVGDGGRVRFFVAHSSLDLVADLAGYYAPTGSQGFTAVDPVRLADTRRGLGLPGGALQPRAPRDLTVVGGPVPAGATGVVLNVTAAMPSGPTFLRVSPASAAAPPLVSNLNVVPGRNEANAVVVRVGDAGAVTFYSDAAAVDAVVDLGGFFRTFS